MDDQTIVAIVVGAFSVFAAFLVSIIIIMIIRDSNRKKTIEIQSQKIIFEKTVEAETKQKEQIFRNMHDQVNPMLRFVVRNLQVYQKKVANGKLKAEELDADIDMLLTALNDIRSCTHELVPVFMLDYGLVKGLEEVTKKLCESSDVQLTILNNLQSHFLNKLDENKQINIYRLVLTLLENILMHSNCNSLCLVFTDSSFQSQLTFTHDGIGISDEEVELEIQKNKGIGLKSARARSLLVNAIVTFTKIPEPQIKFVLKHT